MTKKVDSIVTQLNIRNNVREMQDSVKDLYAWEDEMNRKEKARLKQSKAAVPRAPPVRGRAAPVQQSADATLHQPSKELVPGKLRNVIHRSPVGPSPCPVGLCSRRLCSRGDG